MFYSDAFILEEPIQSWLFCNALFLLLTPLPKGVKFYYRQMMDYFAVKSDT